MITVHLFHYVPAPPYSSDGAHALCAAPCPTNGCDYVAHTIDAVTCPDCLSLIKLDTAPAREPQRERKR